MGVEEMGSATGEGNLWGASTAGGCTDIGSAKGALSGSAVGVSETGASGKGCGGGGGKVGGGEVVGGGCKMGVGTMGVGAGGGFTGGVGAGDFGLSFPPHVLKLPLQTIREMIKPIITRTTARMIQHLAFFHHM